MGGRSWKGPEDPATELDRERLDVVVGGGRERDEPQGAVVARDVHAVQKKRMEVDVQRQRGREALDEGDAAGLAAHNAVDLFRPVAQVRKHGIGKGAQDDIEGVAVVGESVAQAVGERT